MNKPDDTDDFKAAAQDALRGQCRAILDEEGLKQSDLARESGVAYGTFTAWMTGNYAGRNDRIAAEVARWLKARIERRAAVAEVPRAPGFLRTPSAEGFLQVLMMAQVLPDISAIVGGAGIGKTMAARHYRETSPNVTLVTANPSTSKANTILGAVAEELRLTERNSTRLYKSIGAKLVDAQALIVVDEAQHLTLGALEQLRALHDIYGVGLAFIGNETVHGLLSGGRNGTEHAQLSSRFGYRVVQRKPRERDIEMLLDAWGVIEAEERKFLGMIGRKPGALRAVTKALRLAGLMAEGRPRDLGHIRAAYERQTRAPETGAEGGKS